MNNFTSPKGTLFLLALTFLSLSSSAQSVSSSPANVIRPTGGSNVSVQLSRNGSNNSWNNGNGNYVWTVDNNIGVTIGSYTQTGGSAGDVTATFSGAAQGAYTFTLKRGNGTSRNVTVHVGNIVGSTNSGGTIAGFNVTNGTYSAGPNTVFSPNVQTSALGLSMAGYFYYLPNDFNGNDGNITVYAANPNGTGRTAIGSVDLNGSNNNDLGFVRLAIDGAGIGWILAGDNNNVYLGRFTANGTNATAVTLVDPSVTLVNGNVSSFFNGDICFSGNGTLYALANSSNGNVTQIFVGNPNGTNTTLTKKWDLVDENGHAFTGSVNGVAFDLLGSLYISTSEGLYYIDQNTVNTATGTVHCQLVWSGSGLTDLASNLFPQQTTLPVHLLSFGGTFRSNVSTLSWQTENEENFDHYEIERSTNGTSFGYIGTHASTANGASRQDYQYTDDLSNVSGTTFYYRLKIVDRDGRISYSNVIVIRKDSKALTNITLNPSPVINGVATARFSASGTATVNLNVIDLTGKVVLQQQANVFEGNNSVSVNNLSHLQPGTYVLQLVNGSESSSVKFTVAH